nr:MAG TPA: hypothetical protein [Caudoviricetes sp.]
MRLQLRGSSLSARTAAAAERSESFLSVGASFPPPGFRSFAFALGAAGLAFAVALAAVVFFFLALIRHVLSVWV